MTEKALKARLDTRLFLRLGLNYLACEAGSFILLIALKSTLRAHVYLLKEVLEVPLGFTLYTNSLEALITLKKYFNLIIAFIKDY